MSPDMKTLREALERATSHDAASYAQASRVVLLATALDELEALRGQAAYVASLDTENQRLRAEKAEAQRDELASVLEEAFDWMGYNPPSTGWGTLDHGNDKSKCDIMARGNVAIANARGGK